jgi:hypothetical protein
MKNEKRKMKNEICVLRTVLLTPSAKREVEVSPKLFFRRRRLKIARSAQLPFLIFHFYFLIFNFQTPFRVFRVFCGLYFFLRRLDYESSS